MITLLRGDSRALFSESARIVAAAEGHLPLAPPHCPRAWNGLRRLLAELREHLGGAVVERVLRRHRPAVSLVPGELRGALREAERIERGLLAARPTSHLSHNFLLQGPLFQAWASCVHELTKGRELTLVVPDLAQIDRESLALLRTLHRRFPETAPGLVAGFDPERRTPQGDRNGLIFEHPREDIWKVALGFMAMPRTEVRDLARNEPEAGGISDTLGRETLDPEDRAIDARALRALTTPGQVSEEQLIARTVDAMRASFAGFSFTTTLRLGLLLFERQPELTPEQAADAHGLLALSAHNRQFRSRGNLRLAEFLQSHLESALVAEKRPDHRSAISYRLAVTLSRRKKDHEAGIRWAERAISEAGSPRISPVDAANLEGWGRNIRAFALTGKDRLEDAATECEAAFGRLSALLETRPDPMRSRDASLREAVVTRSLLADNLAAIAQMSGDPERLERWKRTADRLAETFPELERYEARHWIALYRRKLRLGAAAERARRGLAAARAGQDGLREYRYTVELADLRYRTGEARAAYEGFERAEQLRRRLGSPDFLRPTKLSTAASAARAGEMEIARDLALRALAAHDPTDHDARSQVLAFLGLSAARDGDGREAEERMNEAIELAVKSGARDTLLAVAVAAGRASQHLGRGEEARRAYRQALEIAGTELTDADSVETEPAGAGPPPALELAAHLGLWETGEASPAHRIRCLRLLPEALDDAETWWDLRRMLRMVSSRAGQGSELPAPEMAASLHTLRLAAEQRRDLDGIEPFPSEVMT